VRTSTILCLLPLLAPSVLAQTCGIERVSLDASGVEGDGASTQASITPDGRYVVFVSAATNLVPGDTNGVADVFVSDLRADTIERVNLGPGGIESDASSAYPVLSDDGRFVAFHTAATNLVSGDVNGALDVFVRDRVTGTIERVSDGPGGVQGDGPSFGATFAGGSRYVLFVSWATNLVALDTNAVRDVFFFDRTLGTLERVSVSSAGIEGDDMSGSGTLASFATADGRYVFFGSMATNLVAGDTNASMDVFVRDRWTGMTSLLVSGPGGGVPNGWTDLGVVTSDGRFASFSSTAENLVQGDTNGVGDAFVVDRSSGSIDRVNVSSTGAQSPEGAGIPVLSADGRFAVFTSAATDLAPNDWNGKRDVFRRDRAAGTTELFVPGNGIAQPQQDVFAVSISAAGDRCAFSYSGDDLAGLDQNSVNDVLVDGCTTGSRFCSGDGTAGACPCGVGDWQAGCPNAETDGAVLDGAGRPRTNVDTLALVVRGLPTNTVVAFLLGSSKVNGGSGTTFGDGLRCVGGNIVRLATRHSANGIATWGFGVPGAPLLSLQSGVPLGGDVRYYQAWYRNAAPFCTTATYNLTNGFEVSWLP